jgi:hypothetical protein
MFYAEIHSYFSNSKFLKIEEDVGVTKYMWVDDIILASFLNKKDIIYHVKRAGFINANILER